MPETNGHRENPSRLDRMEKMVEHIIGGHIVLEDKLSRLADRQEKTDEAIGKLTANVNHLASDVTRLTVDVHKLAGTVDRLHDAAVLQMQTMDHVISNLDETGGKLNRLIDIVESEHRNFPERLNRLETKQ